MNRRYKIQIKNGLKDSKGALMGDSDIVTGKIRINKNHNKHKKDSSELASTVKHEIMHVNHPRMTEKEVYKKSAKTKITQGEKRKLLAKLYS